MPLLINAGMTAEITLKSPNAFGAVTIDHTGNKAIITLTLDPAGAYLVRAWLADAGADPAVPTDIIPDTSGIKAWEIVTNSTGVAVFTVEHTGAHTWEFRWAVLACVSDGGDLEYT